MLFKWQCLAQAAQRSCGVSLETFKYCLGPGRPALGGPASAGLCMRGLAESPYRITNWLWLERSFKSTKAVVSLWKYITEVVHYCKTKQSDKQLFSKRKLNWIKCIKYIIFRMSLKQFVSTSSVSFSWFRFSCSVKPFLMLWCNFLMPLNIAKAQNGLFSC